MKKLLLFAGLMFIVSTGCEKKKCWQCVTTITYTGVSQPADVSRTSVCDKTKKEIDEFQKTSSSTSSGNGVTIRRSTTCY